MILYTSMQEVEDFLAEHKKIKQTVETTSRATLNALLRFEQRKNKAFYNFTKDEVLEMFKASRSISACSLQNKNLLLKDFTNYIFTKKNINRENVYNSIDKEDILTCIDVEKQEAAILSREHLSELQKELFNYTDKGILEALFLGLGGYKLKELAFFSSKNIQKDSIISLENKSISINQEQKQLLIDACDETILTSLGSTLRQSKNITHGLFKKRYNALSSSSNQNADEDLERRYRFFQRRLMLISDYLGLNITSGKVQESGFLHFLRIAVEKSGMSFEEYIKTEEMQELANRYDIHTDLYPQIIKEKFERYFK